MGWTVKEKALLARMAQKIGRMGGKARAAKLSPERRSEIARAGGLAKAKKTASQ